jgi:RNA polymerase sigma-70 factor (ECF subfamily)
MTDNALECSLESRTETVDEDRVLVREAQRDPEAAGRLYDKYYRRVLAYIYHCTLDDAVTEDLTSNVFLAALAHLGRYKWRKVPFRAWLYRIATNEIRMHYRKQRYARSVDLQTRRGVAEGSAPCADESPAATEEYDLLHKALLELPLKHRTAIILRYFEGRTIAEICDVTSSREGTVKSQLHRGLTQLQEILQRCGVLRE